MSRQYQRQKEKWFKQGEIEGIQKVIDSLILLETKGDVLKIKQYRKILEEKLDEFKNDKPKRIRKESGKKGIS